MVEAFASAALGESTSPRDVANKYVHALSDVDPSVALILGINVEEDRLPDLSPAGADATAGLAQRALVALDAVEDPTLAADPTQRRCANLLRERLTAQLAMYGAGEHYRAVSSLSSPLHNLRKFLSVQPRETAEDWEVVGRRLSRLPFALQQYRTTLSEGMRLGILARPRQVSSLIRQLDHWLSGDHPGNWMSDLLLRAPETQRVNLGIAAAAATRALAELCNWLRNIYSPETSLSTDSIGKEDYRRWVRYWNGTNIDLDQTFHWAWEQFRQVSFEMREEAQTLQSGATPMQAMASLENDGPIIEGAANVISYLQQLLNQAISDLQGRYFDIAAPLLQIESLIAPAGPVAPYYTEPSLDFSRPGRAWLPTLGRDRFPIWNLAPVWYHEGVPGHHLQYGQWAYVSEQLSTYQMSVGVVSANVEGWALYAEHLMDELGYFTEVGGRLGYLNARMLRVLRVILDIGLHTGRRYPEDSPCSPGEIIEPTNARKILGECCGFPNDFLDGELDRYLGSPGQAIGHLLGERVWREGRSAAEGRSRANGETFDLKAWHMDVLSQGSLGLDHLADELGRS
jgi:uncharacterized protein (DUF885 family)